MKRTLKILISSILACLVIAGSAISTSAASGRRVVYFYGNGSNCGDRSCSDNSCGSQTCPQSLTDLYSFLKKLGCDENSCSDLYDKLRSYGCEPGCTDNSCASDNTCENGSCTPDNTCAGGDCTSDNACESGSCAPTESCANGSCDTPAATEAPTQAPTQPATQAPTQASTQPATQAPTEAAEQKPAAQGYTVSAYEQEVVTLINQIRRQNGLGSLSINTELSRVARIKSQDMHDKGYFSHTSPTYGSPFDMMTAFGIRYRTAGENIAVGYRTPQSVVDGWMNSEGHRKNILNPNFKEIGMGYVESGHYWTQMFIG